MNFKAPKDSYTEKERRILGEIKNLFPASSGDGAALMVGGGKYEDGGTVTASPSTAIRRRGPALPGRPGERRIRPGLRLRLFRGRRVLHTGEERAVINKAFDKLINYYKEQGLLHTRAPEKETVKEELRPATRECSQLKFDGFDR